MELILSHLKTYKTLYKNDKIDEKKVDPTLIKEYDRKPEFRIHLRTSVNNAWKKLNEYYTLTTTLENENNERIIKKCEIQNEKALDK